MGLRPWDTDIACKDCHRIYDSQDPRCPNCSLPTVLSRMWTNQGGKPPGISGRAWTYGLIGAIMLWLTFAAIIVALNPG